MFRRLLTAVLTGCFVLAIAMTPVYAGSNAMPNLKDGYVPVDLAVGACPSMVNPGQSIVIGRVGYNLVGNEQAAYYDATAFFVQGYDQPFLVVLFSNASEDNTKVVAVIYTDPNMTGVAQDVVHATVAVIEKSGVDICKFAPVFVDQVLP